MFDLTLRGVISQVDAGRVVLPAMQRPFVWDESRIIQLIDSLLRGFPLGAVMLWKSQSIQRYRRFQKDIRSEGYELFRFESDGADHDRYLVLDGQQRLTSLLAATHGSYDGKRFYLNVLSGKAEGKDTGDIYYEGKFLTAKAATAANSEEGSQPQHHFELFSDLVSIPSRSVATRSLRKGTQLGLREVEIEQLSDVYHRAAAAMGEGKALQVIVLGENPDDEQSIEEVLEIFVRVNSGGLKLEKADLLMSLLDLEWNDIQPELMAAVEEINRGRPYNFTRDNLLKSLLLVLQKETRFDRLVADRSRLADLAPRMAPVLPPTLDAWKFLGVILNDDCKIYSERFFRGGYNALLPFVIWLYRNPRPTPNQRRELRAGIYIALMSGVFASAEARMGKFVRDHIRGGESFPIERLCDLVKWHTGVSSFKMLFPRHLDLALNIAHGGKSLDNNPENLQRDHIFPRSTLEGAGTPADLINHFANFHFLRGDDNLNKSNRPPNEWFRSPGSGAPPYSDQDLNERLLSWDLLEPGKFEDMIENRQDRIFRRAEDLFGSSTRELDALFAQD